MIMQQSLRMLLLSPQSLMGFAGTPENKDGFKSTSVRIQKNKQQPNGYCLFLVLGRDFRRSMLRNCYAVASNSITITAHISPLCKIASAQFCNKQITNTVSHNKKEQIPNGTCSFLVRETGLEPVRVAPHAPQTCASADSATLAQRI